MKFPKESIPMVRKAILFFGSKKPGRSAGRLSERAKGKANRKGGKGRGGKRHGGKSSGGKRHGGGEGDEPTGRRSNTFKGGKPSCRNFKGDKGKGGKGKFGGTFGDCPPWRKGIGGKGKAMKGRTGK